MKRHIKDTVCPWCGYRHELATNITGRRAPVSGDKTMCFRCEGWSIFDPRAPGGLRMPTQAELDEIVENRVARAIIRMGRW